MSSFHLSANLTDTRPLIERALTIPNLQRSIFFACKTPKQAALMCYVSELFKEVMLDEMFQSFKGSLHIQCRSNILKIDDLVSFYTKIIENKLTLFIDDFPITCAYCDQLGNRITQEVFTARVSGLTTLAELQAMMLDKLTKIVEKRGDDENAAPGELAAIKQYVNSSCFTFVEVEDTYRIERLQIMNEHTTTLLAGARTHDTSKPEAMDKEGEVHNYYHAAKLTTVANFFLEGYLQDQIFLNKPEMFRVVEEKNDGTSFYQNIFHGVRTFDLRPYPEVDAEHQVYCVWHGEIATEPWRIEHRISKLKPPALVAIPNTYDVHKMFPLMKEIFDMKDEDFYRKRSNRQVWIFIHWVLHFPLWTNKMKDFFFYNKNNRTRPKAIVIHHRGDDDYDKTKDKE